MEEVWKDIIINNIKTNYQISNLGKVKRLAYVTIVWNRHQHAERHYKELILSPANDQDGYKLVSINAKTYKVHRLVAIAFIPNLENKSQVNHINGIKFDNRVENLEWNTGSENQDHAYITNLKMGPIGKKNGNVKLNEKIILEIKEMLLNKIPSKDIAFHFNIHPTHVSSIKNGNTWSQVTGFIYNGRTKKFRGTVKDFKKKEVDKQIEPSVN